MDQIILNIKQFLYSHISTGSHQAQIIEILILGAILSVAVISYYLSNAALRLTEKAIEKSPTKWDDDLIDSRLIRALSQLAPALVINWLLPAFFRANESDYVHWIKILTAFYILWTIVHIATILTDNLFYAMSRRKRTRPYAVKGIFQMVKLLLFGLGIIIGISILFGKEPIAILTALGASAAILMLVFKDTILGLVASVQLTANKMLHKGDWIIADKYGANGEVEDVSLTTVKVRNWDNSVSTIPPYNLISDSFRNYQAMRVSGGRCIERSIFVDANSVRFCTPSELKRLDDLGWLEGIAPDRAARQVNLTLFRRYLEKFLSMHKDVNKDMLHMVRQMQPTPSGLPLQLYFYTKRTGWKDFEHVQSDIFDHVYAVIGEFGLRVFQTPAGSDLSAICGINTPCGHNNQTIINQNHKSTIPT